MMRILLCDDDLSFLNKLNAVINAVLIDCGIKAKVHMYSNWNDIGMPILSSCDMAFLDIDFAKKNYTGIDIAKKIRSIRPDAVIIFVTNYIEYAPIGYEVAAFRYILKYDLTAKLHECLQLAISQLRSTREKIKFQINGELIDICIKDIIYIESQQHTVYIHVQQDTLGKKIKTYRFYASLSDVEHQLEPHGFLRIHKSYLVNMEFIIKLKCHEALLTNGTVLRVSEKNYACKKEKYLFWKGR